LTRKIVGQIINIVDSDSYLTVTIETAAGDITHLRYDESASGLEPVMGVICSISYEVVGDYLSIRKIERPKAGEYRATYEKAQPPEAPLKMAPPPSRSTSSESTAIDDLSRDDESFFPSTYPSYSTPSSSRRTAPSRVVEPRKSASRDSVPDGVALITVSYLVAGLICIVIPYPLTIILGVFFLITALGWFFYQPWAYAITTIISILFAITIIGLIIAIPLWSYLRKKEIRTLYVVP